MKPFRTFLLGAIVGASGALAIAQADLDINIRTTVEIPKDRSLGAHPTFLLFPPVQVAAAERLARPVAPATLEAIPRLLQERLQAMGYVGVVGKEKPELLITTQYGRGQLPNPYNADRMGRIDPNGTETTSVTGLPDARRFEVEREAKRQFANEEKLFFTISALDFASLQKNPKKPTVVWTTTMIVDDPDHRDLNGIYKQMIAAGAEYFNRRIDREEVQVPTAIREGRVEIGTPSVVDDSKAKK